ncbi:MAG: hypothetical protein JO305_04960 [Alphaproteobacteria bacterium]|nr:hypothetical protein [Alphaproteobacteria bacterium]
MQWPRRPGCRFSRRNAGLFALLAVVGLDSGCLPVQPWLRQGDANSAEIGYAGDLQGATRIAGQHCAAYERVARLVRTDLDFAYFDCLPR